MSRLTRAPLGDGGPASVPSARFSRRRRVRVHSQQVSRLDRFQPLQLHQVEDLSLPHGNLAQQGPNQAQGSLHLELLERVFAPRRLCLRQLPKFLDQPSVPPLPALVIQTGVTRNPVEPARNPGAAVEALDRREHLHHDELCDILRVVGIAGQDQRPPANNGSKMARQPSERLLSPVLALSANSRMSRSESMSSRFLLVRPSRKKDARRDGSVYLAILLQSNVGGRRGTGRRAPGMSLGVALQKL